MTDARGSANQDSKKIGYFEYFLLLLQFLNLYENEN